MATPFAVSTSTFDGVSNANVVTGSARQKAKKGTIDMDTPTTTKRAKKPDDLSMHHIASFQASFDFGSPMLRKP